MKKFGRTAALVLSAVLTVSSVLPAYAAEGTNELKGQFTYTAQDGTVFEKVSHPDTGLEQADGIVDYLGNGQIGEHVNGTSTVGEGDRGQSYSYAGSLLRRLGLHWNHVRRTWRFSHSFQRL